MAEKIPKTLVITIFELEIAGSICLNWESKLVDQFKYEEDSQQGTSTNDPQKIFPSISKLHREDFLVRKMKPEFTTLVKPTITNIIRREVSEEILRLVKSDYDSFIAKANQPEQTLAKQIPIFHFDEMFEETNRLPFSLEAV